MQECNQFDSQTVYEHGLSVQSVFIDLYNKDFKDYPIPNWLINNFNFIKSKLLNYEQILEYTLFHDVGKPFCIKTVDNIRHFPNHAEVSYDIYNKYFDNKDVAYCILHDMDIHTIKDKDINSFINKYTYTLLFVGLAEILANAKYFGGYDSTSFKIKYKQINKRGNAIMIKELEKLQKDFESESLEIKILKKRLMEKETIMVGLKKQIDDLKEKIRVDNLKKGLDE